MSPNNDDNKPSAWIPFLFIVYNFCANLANDIYLPSLPRLEKEFLTTSSQLQLTMTTWFLGVATPQLFFGPLSDRFGRRPILFWGGFLFLLSTLACSLASNVWILIVGRFIQGIGVCSLNVVTFSILIDLYHYKYRTQIMSKINMVGILAPILGPILGGYILIYFGWRYNFVLIFTIGFLALLGLWYKLPESNLHLNLKALDIKNMYVTYWHLLCQKGFLKHLLPYCLILGGLIAYLTSAPFIIIQQLKIPIQYFGFTQVPIFSAYVLGSCYLSFIQDEAKLRLFLMRGIVLVCTAGLLMLVSSLIWDDNLYSFIFPMVLYALGFSLCGSVLVNEVMSSATHAKGSAAAFLGFGMAMSCMISSLLVGIIYNETIFVIALLLLMISLCAFSVYSMKDSQKSVEVGQD